MKSELAAVGRFFAEKSWSLATSSNYSCRKDKETIWISKTSVDKFKMQPTDFITVDLKAQVLDPQGARASAETLIHCCIYNERPKAQSVLHTHSVLGTRLSLRFEKEKRIQFSGYEMLKALDGNQTHEMTESLPILPNDQDMPRFCEALKQLLRDEKKIHGFLMAGHGLYTWGQSIAEARRHIEAYEFLLQCKEKELLGV